MVLSSSPPQTTASPPQLHLDTDNVNATATAAATAATLSASAVTATAESKDATVKEESTAPGQDTFGNLNQHPTTSTSTKQQEPPFKVGVSVERNRKFRRTMEDSHSFIYDFGGIRGQGYFAVFDGHAGKHAAEWCGNHFHEHLLSLLSNSPTSARIPDILNQTFHTVDKKLSELAQKDGTHSGCTAVTAFLRLEDEDGKPVGEIRDTTRRGKIRELLSPSPPQSVAADGGSTPTSDSSTLTATEEPSSIPAQSFDYFKRTLYTANVGDARAVLSRGGRAVRLTYDHKGSDQKEAKRITDAGGFVMNNRVNGVLAVTRSLGDSSMKEFVVGSPYTTETTLGKDDQWLIVACDGLWDVCKDQEAVDILKTCKDAQDGSKKLLDHALQNFSTDNLSVLVISLQ